VIARGRLAREHERVGAEEDRVRDVARLGARGARGLRHRLEHLGRDDDRTPDAARDGQDLPLDDRHALGRELDPEVAARHHDAVGRGHDRLEVLDRVGRLDLRDDRRGLAPLARDVADELDVVGAPHEAERDVVDAAAEAEGEVLLVLLGERGEAHRLAGEVHADVVAHASALLDARLHLFALDRGHEEDDAPVVEQDAIAHAHVGGEALVLDRDRALVGARVALDERDLGRRGQVELRGEAPRAHLGAAEILERGDGLALVVARLAEARELLAVLLVGAVREVEARDVHPRSDELLERVDGAARRAEGADELGAPNRHRCLFLCQVCAAVQRNMVRQPA
jgi:hypothetical protein